MWFEYQNIYVCQRNGRHLIAFKGDSTIFNAILAPLCDTTPSLHDGGSLARLAPLVMTRILFGKFQETLPYIM